MVCWKSEYVEVAEGRVCGCGVDGVLCCGACSVWVCGGKRGNGKGVLRLRRRCCVLFCVVSMRVVEVFVY